MKLLLPICLIIPDVVYLWPFDRLQDVSTYKYFLPNYLYFCAPLFLWYAISFIVRPAVLVKNLGYMGAVIPLIFLSILFSCCMDNSNALGWLYLWPFSILSIAVCTIGAYIWRFDLYLIPRTLV